MATRQRHDREVPTRNDDDDDVEVTFTVTTPEDADPEFNIRLWTSSDGYTSLNDVFPGEEPPEGATDAERGPTYLHKLAAAVNGDPEDAFADPEEMVCHHKSHIEIDSPEYVETLTPSDHTALHTSQAFQFDQRGIPVRAHADDVSDDESVDIEPPGAGDLSRWALPRREDATDESDGQAAESDDESDVPNVLVQ